MSNEMFYESYKKGIPEKVFFTGTTALSTGMGLCYDRDYYTAASGEAVTDAWGKRDKFVAMPATTNNMSFAGVCAHNYAASSTGQWIEIYKPGSTCLIVTAETTVTIGENSFMSCMIDASNNGYWQITNNALGLGKGVAKVLQTISAAGLIMVELLDGPDTGLAQNIVGAAAGGAITCTPFGATYVDGATVNDAHITYTLPSGTVIGQRKYFEITASVGNSKNFNITGVFIQVNDDSTAGTNLEIDNDNDVALLEWNGTKWGIVHSVGCTLS